MNFELHFSQNFAAAKLWNAPSVTVLSRKSLLPGFYDTSEEQARIASAPGGQTLRWVEKRKPEDEATEQKRRQRKAEAGKDRTMGQHQAKFIAARDAQIQKLKDP